MEMQFKELLRRKYEEKVNNLSDDKVNESSVLNTSNRVATADQDVRQADPSPQILGKRPLTAMLSQASRKEIIKLSMPLTKSIWNSKAQMTD